MFEISHSHPYLPCNKPICLSLLILLEICTLQTYSNSIRKHSIFSLCSIQSEEANMKPSILWFGHDTFCIAGSKKIYIDPFQLKRKDTADIILITHTHYDHFSPDDIAKLTGADTATIGPHDAVGKVNHLKTMQPGDMIELKGITIEAVPAYNVGKKFHPKSNNWLGFVITIDNTRIYHAGDTDHIPEMKTLKNIDIALLPVSGTYVMTAQEAVQAAREIRPKLAIPMHYGSIVGTIHDAENFKRELTGSIDVQVLQKQ